MTVTFASEFRETDVIGYVLSCCPECKSEPYATYGEATAARAALPGFEQHTAALPGCPTAGTWGANGIVFIDPVLAEEGPSINMANTNARFMLDRLGLVTESGELCGETTAADLRGRILLADALAGGDAGLPDIETIGPGGAVVVECGRAPGYLDARLGELAELVDWCAERDRLICWG